MHTKKAKKPKVIHHQTEGQPQVHPVGIGDTSQLRRRKKEQGVAQQRYVFNTWAINWMQGPITSLWLYFKLATFQSIVDKDTESCQCTTEGANSHP